MSATAPTSLHRAIRFYEASIGKKAVMAVTGAILFAYVAGHLVGNLQIYRPDQGAGINAYARFLHSNPGPLWAVRLVLLLAVALHVIASIQLWKLKHDARPIGYYKKDDVPTAYAARTMLWSGPIIAAFVIFHVLHLTTGQIPGVPFEELNVYHNVIGGFRNVWVSGFYILAMALVGMHLYHGLWSMFQSIGWDHPRYTPALKRFAAVVALIVSLGNISIPVAVLTGLVTEQGNATHATRLQNSVRPN